jgi:hypothetical protein
MQPCGRRIANTRHQPRKHRHPGRSTMGTKPFLGIIEDQFRAITGRPRPSLDPRFQVLASRSEIGQAERMLDLPGVVESGHVPYTASSTTDHQPELVSIIKKEQRSRSARVGGFPIREPVERLQHDHRRHHLRRDRGPAPTRRGTGRRTSPPGTAPAGARPGTRTRCPLATDAQPPTPHPHESRWPPARPCMTTGSQPARRHPGRRALFSSLLAPTDEPGPTRFPAGPGW